MKDSTMKVVDLSHVMNIHTPGWVGYAGNKMYYAQNLQTQMIVAQRIETALHAGTHFDGAMHATDGRKGDMASLAIFSSCTPAGTNITKGRRSRIW
jgi:kynurenine formamidase